MGNFHAIEEFLLSFTGLRHLRLKLSNLPECGNSVRDVFRHHTATLETIVYHERQLQPMDNEGLFEAEHDVSPMWNSNISAIMNLDKVTALALCTTPSVAVCLHSLKEMIKLINSTADLS
jgi:hypothetical protein